MSSSWIWNVGGASSADIDTSGAPIVRGDCGNSSSPMAKADCPLVLFTTYFGSYPCIGCDGTDTTDWCNGGLPQLANYSYHFEEMGRQLDSRVPLNFTGHVVLDYESYLTWPFASDVYHNASIALARRDHPEISDETELAEMAEKEFTAAVNEFYASTLLKVRELRPQVSGVGYYGFPCRLYYHDYHDNPEKRGWNDAMGEIWNASTALFPSIYAAYMTNDEWGFAKQAHNLAVNLDEFSRVAAGTLEVIPYTWYRYHDGESHGLELLSEVDTQLQFFFPLNWFPRQVIWGSEADGAAADETTEFFAGQASAFAMNDGWAPLAEGGVSFSPLVGGGDGGGSGDEEDGKGREAAGGHLPLQVDPFGPVPDWLTCGL